MKTILTTIIASLSLTVTLGQSFVNGSFEKTTFDQSCQYNNSNDDINNNVTGVYAFGAYEAVDMLMANCIITDVAEGNFALGIANKPSENSVGEAVSLELTEELIEGQQYEISFKAQAITKYGPKGNLLFGLSSSKNAFGSQIFEAVTVDGKWTKITFKFTASAKSKFITIKPKSGVSSWNIVDDFVITKI